MAQNTRHPRDIYVELVWGGYGGSGTNSESAQCSVETLSQLILLQMINTGLSLKKFQFYNVKLLLLFVNYNMLYKRTELFSGNLIMCGSTFFLRRVNSPLDFASICIFLSFLGFFAILLLPKKIATTRRIVRNIRNTTTQMASNVVFAWNTPWVTAHCTHLRIVYRLLTSPG